MSENLDRVGKRETLTQEDYLKELSKVNNSLTNLQRELAKKNIKLEEALFESKKSRKSLDEFISLVGHELKTPITVINLSMQTLFNSKKPLSSSNELQLKDMIMKNTEIMRELIDELLMMSKLQVQKLSISKDQVVLKELLNEIIQSLKVKLDTKNIVLAAPINSDLVIHADRKKIRLVFKNIIDNAINYSNESGSIKVISKENDSGKFMNIEGILIQIIDNGKGIQEKELSYIFDKFYTSDSVEGTGLGLAISKDIVKLHGGDIFVESEVGKGSIFTILLPKKI